jgi:hypothetical protein
VVQAVRFQVRSDSNALLTAKTVACGPVLESSTHTPAFRGVGYRQLAGATACYELPSSVHCPLRWCLPLPLRHKLSPALMQHGHAPSLLHVAPVTCAAEIVSFAAVRQHCDRGTIKRTGSSRPNLDVQLTDLSSRKRSFVRRDLSNFSVLSSGLGNLASRPDPGEVSLSGSTFASAALVIRVFAGRTERRSSDRH